MTSSPWVVIKEMLDMEKFAMFARAHESMSQEEWYTHVKEQFLVLLSPSEEWWQEYLAWIETNQFRAMQQWVTKGPQSFVKP